MWEETVLKDEQIKKIQIETDNRISRFCNDCEGNFNQADIDGMYDEGNRSLALAQAQITGDIAYKRGMMKVVEWINSNCTSDSGDGYLCQVFYSYAWQAFLKENGIKEN